ncbi:MAG: hypothetical protein HY040_22250 [Planctomycetes bacterium]|nr:hypothetical protein [Planctomycetota bacterium]
MRSRWTTVALAGLSTLLVLRGITPRPALDAGADLENPSHTLRAAFLGPASCGTASCHGGNGEVQGSELSIWLVRDPHARSGETLLQERSRAILRKWKSADNVAPETEQLCIRCHVGDASILSPNDAGVHSPARIQDGVSCEACHGSAAAWIRPHVQPEWQQKSPAQKQSFGMRDTRSLPGRAATCVDCHVGAPGQAVDHDMLAAGHPRLRFEFGAYHANWPHHWTDGKDRNGHPDFEARAWAIGQATGAEAFLRLLHDAASDSNKAWPEFAALDCFACHHDLNERSWRLRQAAPGRSAGAMRLSPWYTALLSEALLGDEKTARILADLDKLKDRMTPPVPDRKAITTLTTQMLEALRSTPFISIQEAFPTPLILSELAKHGKKRLQSWDEAAAIYLALAALQDGLTEGNARPAREYSSLLKGVHEALRFPPGCASPSRFEPETVRRRLSALGK